MSEHITHTAILDDAFRLAGVSQTIDPAMKTVMATQRAMARLGSVTRKGDKFTVDLLTKLRQRRNDAASDQDVTDDEIWQCKLAFVLAWLCHRAADRQMKPVFREVEPDSGKSPTDASIYHDAFVFHEVFRSGEDEPMHPNLFADKPTAASKSDTDALDELMQMLLQRNLIALHTLIPNADDVETWLEGLLGQVQRIRIDRKRYAEAIANPDPEIYRRAIEAVNFYDRNEPVIRLARAIQRGESVSPAEVDQAWPMDAKCHYAQALAKSMKFLTAASEFLQSEMKPEPLAERLEIGQKGRDGGVV